MVRDNQGIFIVQKLTGQNGGAVIGVKGNF